MEVKESSVLSGPNYLELTALLPNRRYDVWVKAATGVGYGASSVVACVMLGRMGKLVCFLFERKILHPEKKLCILVVEYSSPFGG